MLEEKLKAGILIKDTNPLRVNVASKNIIREIKDCINKYNLDIFLGPEFVFALESRLYNKHEKDNLLKGLAESTKNKDTLIIPGSIIWFDKNSFYNTSPIIAEGQVLGEYHKHLDCGSSLRAHRRGYTDKEYFRGDSFERHKWRGLNISVEICADRGELAGFLKTMPDEPLLDLYFLVSCGPYLPKNIPVKNLGYGLCSNGDNLKTEVLKRDDFDKECRFKVIHSKNNIINYTPRIDIYELEIDKCA